MLLSNHNFVAFHCIMDINYCHITDSRTPILGRVFSCAKKCFDSTFFQKCHFCISSELTNNEYNSPCLCCNTFTGKEKDSETGFYYFGARYYDPTLSGLFLSVDPMADKYPSISPYAYCAWNPVRLVDPDGREIDLSALYDNNGNRRKGCESFCKVFEFFAKSSIGQKYLGKYAKKGQIIAGHEYTKDGVYHRKGIDLNIEYGRSQYNVDNTSGRTDANTIKDGRLKLKIFILPEISGKDSKANLLETFCHEFFIHAIQYSDKFSPLKAKTWKTQGSDAKAQHMADINKRHLMRDCALPILTEFCGGNKQKAIDIISQETNYKSHPSWHKK